MRTSARGKVSDADHVRMTMLSEMASYRIEELLDDLGVRARRVGKMFVGPCPVHAGDKANGWNLYPDGHTARGLWYCRTRECQNVFRRTLPGLVRGVLSRNEAGWEPGRSEMVSLKRVLDYLCGFLGQEWASLKPDLVAAEKRRFVHSMATLGLAPEVRADGWELERVRQRLDIPSPYFRQRGFSAAVLDRFSVGDAKTGDVASPLYLRAAVPVLDAEGRVVVGVSGRSLFGRCPDCGAWHEGHCPPAAERGLPSHAKWRHTEGFRAEHHLYNWWGAREHAARTGKLLLLEGPGNVWRAEEAGFGGAVARFGVSLSDRQQILLESSGATDLYVCVDRDEAGERGGREVAGRLRRAFRVHLLEPPGEDLGETPADEVRKWLYQNKLVG